MSEDVTLKTMDGMERISSSLWLMFTICFLGNVLGGTISTLMSVYLPVVVKDLLGPVEEGQLQQTSAYISALYFVGWAIGGLIWGVIGDRIGRARSLAMTVGMFGLFSLLTGIASSWEMVMICRFFCGFGVGGMLVINTTFLSEVWPERSRAVFIGILSIGFPIGIFSSGAVNYFVSGWRQGFMIGLLPLGIAILCLWVVKESEKWKSSRSEHAENKIKRNAVGHRGDILRGSVIFGCMLIGLWATFSWIPTWVQSLPKTSDGQSERSISMMVLGAGGLTGGFLSGWISNTLGVRKAMLICFLGCFALSFLLFKGNAVFSGVTLVEIAALALMFGISQGLLSVYIPLLFPVFIRASATGFCFNIGRFFTAAAVFFVGALVTVLGGYGNAILVFSITFLIGAVTVLFSKDDDENIIS